MATIVSPDEMEARRLAKLRGFNLLDTPAEAEFDAVVSLARKLLGCPIALVSLVDDHRQWFKARCGIDATDTPRGHAFCAHAMHADDMMVVEDARLDPRFADNPLVTGEPGIRFYAGVPLRPASDDFPEALPGIGTLCVIDLVPRTLSPEEAATLRELAGLVSTLIRARAHAHALDRKHRQLNQAERMAGIGSWRLDLALETVSWSDQVFAIYDLPVGSVPPIEEALSFYPVAERPRVARYLERAATHAEAFDFESDFITATGRNRRVRCIGDADVIDGKPAGVIGVFQDVTDRHAREQSLRQTADTDALTRLPNRRCFDARLAAAMADARASGAPLALLLLDLDGFKAVNDALGHAAGDEVLRTTAERLRGPALAHVSAARLGGDEFAILVTRPRDCARLEQLIAAVLGALRQQVGQHRVSATIGAALFDPEMQAPPEFLRRADLALYEAKRHERGTGRIHGSATVIRPRLKPALFSVA